MNEADLALNKYLEEIRSIPLLTPAEEVALARRIEKGNSASRDRMIQANLRLVVTIAQDYVNLGVPLLDLISEGNIGLMKAVDRFDLKKGAKLSTYASWWIKQAIKRALVNQGKTIRLPAQVVEKIGQLRRILAQLSNDLGHEPTDDELGQELGITAERVTRLKSVGLRPQSLDAFVDDDEMTEFGESVPDEQTQTPFESFREKDFSNQVYRLLKTLNQRETTIITERFGLNGTPAKPLEQVAQLIGVTHQRVRKLELAALAKLRRAFSKHLDPLEPEAFVTA
jgi:RNA polymerase primary sigma factor